MKSAVGSDNSKRNDKEEQGAGAADKRTIIIILHVLFCQLYYDTTSVCTLENISARVRPITKQPAQCTSSPI